MASAAPAWINADLFEKVLRNAESNESIRVCNVDAKPAVGKGDNYMSDLFRVHVKFSRDQKGEEIAEVYLIVKIAPYGDFREEVGGAYFTTEISMMSSTLEEMNRILDDVGITALSAKCFHTQNKEQTCLILEDLKQKSFGLANHCGGLDLDHCLIALRKLAFFHASSVALREKDPDAITKYCKGLVHEDQPASWPKYLNASTKNLGQEVAKWPALSSRISEKIIKLSDVTFKKASESVVLRETDFNVLNHGDSWLNNLMFSYDDQGKPTDMMFVDFQLCRYGSPAIDLLYFLGASPCDNVREQKREFLLQEYHAALSSTMTKLNCKTKPPSFTELQQMLRERAFYEVFATFVVLPVVLVDKNDGKGLAEQMQADGTCNNPGYQNEECRKVLTRVLPLYESSGLLDM